MTKTSLSRRAFLRTSIAGGASIAAAGLHAAPIGIYKPGTYSAKAAGIGDVVVTMTFDADKITDVVLDVSHETPAIGQAAAGALKEHLLKAQSAEIDAVSGASITSDAVRKAAQKCIAQAKGEIPLEVITKNEEADDGDWLGQPPEIAEKTSLKRSRPTFSSSAAALEACLPLRPRPKKAQKSSASIASRQARAFATIWAR